MIKRFNKLVIIEIGSKKFIASITEKFKSNKIGVPSTKTPTPTIDCIITIITTKIKLITYF